MLIINSAIPDDLERRKVSVDGCDLACWHRPGEGTRWVLFLHGASMSSRLWINQMGDFPGADLLFLDVRGQGESTMHDGLPVKFEDAVTDIGAVLDTYGVEQAILVGHSWGGNPAQEFAYRHPDRAEALVMIGAWGQIRPMSESELGRIRVMNKVYKVLPWGLVSRVNARACSDVPETRTFIAESIRATGKDVFLSLGLSAYEQVHDIDCYVAQTPTLLIRGSLDYPTALEPIYQRICDMNSAARQVVIEGTRHVPMVDTATEFNRALQGFIDELG